MKEIPLTQNKVALVDDEDFEKVSQFKWYASHAIVKGREYGWYAKRTILLPNGKTTTLKLHRFIMGLERGDPLQVDHINRNTLDNRRTNLRIATPSQNQHNQGIPKHNTSGFKGVRWSAERNTWVANIKVKGKQLFLGRFPTPHLAAAAYDAAALDLHGEFAVTNCSLGLLKKPVQSVQPQIEVAAAV